MALPTVTTQNAVLTSIVDAWQALAELHDVTIYSAPCDLSKLYGDFIYAVDISAADESWYGIGNHRRNEEYTIRFLTYIRRAGADEETIREVRDRAYEIHNLAATYVREHPSHGGVTIAQLSGVDLRQFYTEQDRWCELEWGVRVRAQIEVI